MLFNKLSFKAVILTLAGIASSIAANSSISPLTFGNNVSAQQEANNWNYLTKFKLWGTTGIQFGDRPEFFDSRYYNKSGSGNYSGVNILDSLGWVGTANGSLTSTGVSGWIDGPIIVGGSVATQSEMTLVTGPIRTSTGSISCRHNGTTCLGTNQSGNCSYDKVPEIRSDLTVPTLSGVNFSSYPSLNLRKMDSQRRTVLDVSRDVSGQPSCTEKGVCDLFFSSIDFYDDNRLVIQMPKGGRIVRIFTKSLNLKNHPQIVVSYGDGDLKPSQYNGNLLIYVDSDITFRNTDNADFMGTIVSTGTITVASNMTIAGQFIANKIEIGNEFKSTSFVFKPFVTWPELSILGKDAITFNESDSWQKINVALSSESTENVSFDYCFEFDKNNAENGVNGVYAGYKDAGAADASHKFPICNKNESVKVTIPVGETEVTGINIKPLIDGLVENNEALWFQVNNLTGAQFASDYENGRGYKIYIVSNDKLPTGNSNLVINVNEDEKHVFTEAEFKFQHSTQKFASVIITSLPAKGTIALNGTAIASGTNVAVANLGKLTYQAAANDFGDNYATFKYKVVGSGTSDNTSNEYTATVNVVPVNDKPTVADVTFTVGDRSHSVSGGPIEVNDVFNERNKDTYTYTLVNVSGSDYTAFNSTFEIVKLNDQNATIKVKNSATLDYNQKSEYVVYATVTDDASTETSTIAGPLTSAQFKITVKISDEPETITQESKILPLTFGSGNGAEENDNWNYLSNFKLWGTSGITFGDRPEFYDLRYYNHRTNENDYSGYNDIDPYTLGWVGTANGNMVTGEKGWIDGPVIVGGSITRSGNKMLLVTGPVRTAGSVDVTYRGSMCQGNNQSGACANIPEIRPNLSVPTLSVNLSKERSFSVSGKEVLRITDFCSGNDVCDIYFNSINFMNDSRLVIQMPAGGVPTRIFANRLTFGVHPEIVVNYDNKDLSQKEYEGNLLIYSNDDIDFTYAENHPIMGTFISTKKIILARDALFAGQLIANEVVVGNESHAENFVFKPFKILPNLTLSSKAATFEENNTWQTIKIGLDKEIENDVTFNYCFGFNSQAVAGLYASKDDVADADASHDFPVCGEGSPATATIPKGKIYPSKDIYIKPLIDGLVENSTTDGEKLWLVISDVTGAKLSTDNYDNAKGGFNIFITDVNKQPGVTKELVVNVNEDEKHTFTASEFNFQHESQSFVSVIITALPTAGTLVYNGTTVTEDQVISVADLSKLTYQAAANDFGNSYATFKYKVVGNGTEQNTSAEYTATVNVVPVNDKPSVSDVTFTVGEHSLTVSGGPIEVTDVSNERNKDTYTYTLVNVTGSDYTTFNSTFEIVKLNDQNATIKVKNSATLDYSQKSEYVVYATVTDDAATETSAGAGPLTSAQFKITVKISDEPEPIVQKSKIIPLTFGSSNSAEENDNWNYLMKFKLWGTAGIQFGDRPEFFDSRYYSKSGTGNYSGVNILDSLGWVGTAKGNLTSERQKVSGWIDGPIIVGGSISTQSDMTLITGPIRTSTGNISCRHNGTTCQGTNQSGNCSYDKVPEIRSDLTVPTLSGVSLSSYKSLELHKMDSQRRTVLDVSNGVQGQPGCTEKGVCDLFYSSIDFYDDNRLVIQMPKEGRIVRIFTKSLNLKNHPQIVVNYGDGDLKPNDYEGNLLIYVDSDITFRNTDNADIMGTIVSTGTITVACNIIVAGQFIANKIEIGNEITARSFIFKPFVVWPELSILGNGAITFNESDSWQKINVALSSESSENVSFDYCFEFDKNNAENGVNGVYAGYKDAGAADASHKFPICNKNESVKVTIPAGQKNATGINIKPLIDGLVENNEALWFQVNNLENAQLASDYESGLGYKIYIVSNDKLPTGNSSLVINVNEDEKHVFTEAEFKFQHSTQKFASVIITSLPAKGTIALNGTAIASGTNVAVANLGKLTYQAAANDFGSNYTSFKFKVVGDGSADNTSTEYTAKVNVVPVNDKPTVADVTFTVGDRSHSVSGGPITVTDVSNEIGVDTYTYTLDATSADYSDFNSTFEIVPSGNGKTATLKVKSGAVIDYGKKKEYVVYATVKDNASTEKSEVAGSLTSDKFTITVKIEEENTDPVIANQTFTIPEKNTDGTDWPSGKTIGNVVASDPDDNELSFTVVTTDVPFKFNNNTKELIVTDGSVLDFETKTAWTFMVKVEDGQGGEATAQITIDIEDVLETEIYVNDEGATVISGIASAGTAIENITENSNESTQAQLNEITSEITYAVSEGTSTNATEYFDIDEHGDITAKEDLVFEALYNGNEDNPGNEFTFVITASGTNSKDEPVSTNITKKIIIADVNEQPVIKTEEPIDVPETALSNGEVVGKIDAIDPDSCSFNPDFACRDGSHPQGFNKLTYTIDEILEVDGSTDFPFEIDPNTGVITFRQGPSLIRQYRYNYNTAIVRRVNELNNTRQRRYEFIVKVTDSSTDSKNPPKSVKKKIVINITETAHISSSNSGTSTSSSSGVSSSSAIVSSSSSAETIASSSSVKPTSSSATVASSGSVKPTSSSATVASSGSVKPTSSSATVASSGSVKPTSSSATVASSSSVKPTSSSATVASSGSVKPTSSSGKKITSSSSTSRNDKSSSSNKDVKSSSSKATSSSSRNGEYDAPTFYVRMTGAFEFEIVMDESLPSLAKQYAVMDMKGQVLSVGELNEKGARVKVPTSGAYIVRIGLGYRRINVR